MSAQEVNYSQLFCEYILRYVMGKSADIRVFTQRVPLPRFIIKKNSCIFATYLTEIHRTHERKQNCADSPLIRMRQACDYSVLLRNNAFKIDIRNE